MYNNNTNNNNVVLNTKALVIIIMIIIIHYYNNVMKINFFNLFFFFSIYFFQERQLFKEKEQLNSKTKNSTEEITLGVTVAPDDPFSSSSSSSPLYIDPELERAVQSAKKSDELTINRKTLLYYFIPYCSAIYYIGLY